MRTQTDTLNPQLEGGRTTSEVNTEALILEGLEKRGITPFSAIAQKVVGEFKMRGDSVIFQNDSVASIPCRPDSLRRMLHNLINNAVAYAGMARVRMIDHDDKLSIIIEEEGPGIPDEMVLRVLNPFEHGLRNSESGSGLGLTLSSAVASMHGGELSLARI